jgi:hypothetical protein
VLLGQCVDALPQRLRLLLAEVGAPSIEALVALDLLGPVAREVVEEEADESIPAPKGRESRTPTAFLLQTCLF